MPVQIIVAVSALILSVLSSLVGLYFNEIEGTGFGYSDTWSLGFSILWVAIILWLISDLVRKKKDIRITLALVSIIMFASTALGLLDSALSNSLIFEGLELVLWLVAFFFLNLSGSKEWYAAEN